MVSVARLTCMRWLREGNMSRSSHWLFRIAFIPFVCLLTMKSSGKSCMRWRSDIEIVICQLLIRSVEYHLWFSQFCNRSFSKSEDCFSSHNNTKTEKHLNKDVYNLIQKQTQQFDHEDAQLKKSLQHGWLRV